MEPREIRSWNSQKIGRCCYAELITNFNKETEDKLGKYTKGLPGLF